MHCISITKRSEVVAKHLLLRVIGCAICIRHADADTTALDLCHLDHFSEPKDALAFRAEQVRIKAQGILRYV